MIADAIEKVLRRRAPEEFIEQLTERAKLGDGGAADELVAIADAGNAKAQIILAHAAVAAAVAEPLNLLHLVQAENWMRRAASSGDLNYRLQLASFLMTVSENGLLVGIVDRDMTCAEALAILETCAAEGDELAAEMINVAAPLVSPAALQTASEAVAADSPTLH